MKQLFLTASAYMVMGDLISRLPKNPSSYSLLFDSTASEGEEGEDKWWLNEDRDKLVEVGFKVSDFSFTGKSRVEIEEAMKNIDIIFVAGGNTFYLLDQVIKSGADEVIRRKIEEGSIYIGSSAGSMLVGTRVDLANEFDDRTKAPDLKSNGLGITEINVMPHWGSGTMTEEWKQLLERIYVEDLKIILLSNKQYVWIRDEEIRLIQV